MQSAEQNSDYRNSEESPMTICTYGVKEVALRGKKLPGAQMLEKAAELSTVRSILFNVVVSLV